MKRKIQDFKETNNYNVQFVDREIAETVEAYSQQIIARGFHTDEITACVVRIGDAEITEVWVTDDNRPYELGTYFERVFPANRNYVRNDDQTMGAHLAQDSIHHFAYDGNFNDVLMVANSVFNIHFNYLVPLCKTYIQEHDHVSDDNLRSKALYTFKIVIDDHTYNVTLELYVSATLSNIVVRRVCYKV